MHKITSTTPLDAESHEQRPHAQLLGTDTVDRAQRASEHVVGAAEFPSSLHGDDVPRVLDDADDGRVASRSSEQIVQSSVSATLKHRSHRRMRSFTSTMA